MKVNKIIIIIFFTIGFLVGCEDTSKLKQQISTTLKEENKALCFYVGNIELPYTVKNVVYPIESKSDVWVNNELNRRLDLFSQLGLLVRSSDDKNPQVLSYKLAKLDPNTEFKRGSFCFGDLSLNQFAVLTGSKNKNYKYARLRYAIDNVPLWVNDQRFINYFYSQVIANKSRYFQFNYSYPSLVENKFPDKLIAEMELVPLNDGSVVINDKKDILQTFYSINAKRIWDKDHLTYAYYDQSLAEFLAKISLERNQLIDSWGKDADPILLTNKAIPSVNLAKSTNLIVMYRIIDLALTNNRPKLIKGSVTNTMLANVAIYNSTFQMAFDDTQLLTYYQNTTENSTSTLRRTISREDDNVSESTTWRFYDYFTQWGTSYSNTTTYVVYRSDHTNKLISQHFGDKHFKPVASQYDSNDRILSFDQMTFNYNQNQQLISIASDSEKFVIDYDAKGRLVKIVQYTGSQLKNEQECIYTNHNDKGDWLTKNCNNHEKTTRTIEYYE